MPPRPLHPRALACLVSRDGELAYLLRSLIKLSPPPPCCWVERCGNVCIIFCQSIPSDPASLLACLRWPLALAFGCHQWPQVRASAPSFESSPCTHRQPKARECLDTAFSVCKQESASSKQRACSRLLSRRLVLCLSVRSPSRCLLASCDFDSKLNPPPHLRVFVRK